MRKLPFSIAFTFLLVPGLALADDASEAPLPELTDSPVPEAAEATPDSDPEPEPEPEPALAPAPAPSAPPSPAPVATPAVATMDDSILQPTWQVLAGVRVAYISSAGFDPFAENDALAQGSVSLGRTVYRHERWSLATVGSFDIGHRGATARGQETSLTVFSFGLGPEARYHLGESAWLHLRPSLELSRSLARLDEASSKVSLHARNWHFGFDAMAGGALSLGAPGESEAQVWLVAEGGYTWSSGGSLSLRPDEGDTDAPLRASALDLGNLALRGPAFRIAAALTF